jgi:putative tributyrin esterase
MALIDCKFFSETLGMCSSMRVILPETTERRIGDAGASRAGQAAFRGHPTLFLLHGMSDDETIWTRSTNVERYAAELGLAVVMPNVHRSFYTNMAHGYRYWDFVSFELIDKAREFFPLSHAREDNFVAGNSMGGHGAFKLAMRMPETFAGAASLSGVADVTEFREARSLDFELIFGGPAAEPGSEDDVLHLAQLLAESEPPRPRFYQCCGTEDFLLAQNHRLRERMQSFAFDYLYEEGPGNHDWRYWDKTIYRALEWLTRNQ